MHLADAMSTTIRVPEGAGPGFKMKCIVPDGTEVTLTLPYGTAPGSVITLCKDGQTGLWRTSEQAASIASHPVVGTATFSNSVGTSAAFASVPTTVLRDAATLMPPTYVQQNVAFAQPFPTQQVGMPSHFQNAPPAPFPSIHLMPHVGMGMGKGTPQTCWGSGEGKGYGKGAWAYCPEPQDWYCGAPWFGGKGENWDRWDNYEAGWNNVKGTGKGSSEYLDQSYGKGASEYQDETYVPNSATRQARDFIHMALNGDSQGKDVLVKAESQGREVGKPGEEPWMDIRGKWHLGKGS